MICPQNGMPMYNLLRKELGKFFTDIPLQQAAPPADWTWLRSLLNAEQLIQ
ncbi:MAG: hypothetical protein ACLQOO_23210 [Terriglobia bacterium]